MPSSKDPVINRQKAREWRLANPERHNAANREWARKRRWLDPEWARAKAARDRKNLTPEQRGARAEYQRRWMAAHPDYSRDHQANDNRRNPTKTMVERAKVRAAKAGVPFDLDWREIEIPELCPVLGLPLAAGTGGIRATSPCIDRLVPALGYVKGNVRVISCSANAIKSDKSLEQMRDYARRLRNQYEGAAAVVAYLERELSA
jgi:hypothetical protein